MDLVKWVKDTATRCSAEDIASIVELTIVKKIYSYWESNDDGEDLTLYTGFAVDGVMRRYFIQHLTRDWYGGWTYDDTTTWYEISEQDYLYLCTFTEK